MSHSADPCAVVPASARFGPMSYRHATVRRCTTCGVWNCATSSRCSCATTAVQRSRTSSRRLLSMGSMSIVPPVRRCRTRCGGSGGAGESAVLPAACTALVACRAAPSTGFTDGCSRCGPQQIAQRRAQRHRPRQRLSVLVDKGRPRYGGRRSTEDRRLPSNRLKVREFPGGPRRRTRHTFLGMRRRNVHAPTASCVGALVISRPRTQGGMHGPG